MPALPWTSHATPEPEANYVVMGSTLPLRGYRFIPRFMSQSMKVRRQLATVDGLIGYGLNARLLHKEFWTVSVWESREHLERFSSADPHRTIIRTKPQRMGQSKFVFWTCTGRELPIGWDTVEAHLAE